MEEVTIEGLTIDLSCDIYKIMIGVEDGLNVSWIKGQDDEEDIDPVILDILEQLSYIRYNPFEHWVEMDGVRRPVKNNLPDVIGKMIDDIFSDNGIRTNMTFSYSLTIPKQTLVIDDELHLPLTK
jgi:hypothetical protein